MKKAALLILLFPSLLMASITSVQYMPTYDPIVSGTPYSFGYVSAGDLVVCGVFTARSGAVSLSDSNGNSFSNLIQLATTDSKTFDVFYTLNAVAGQDFVTVTTANDNVRLSCMEYAAGPGVGWSLDAYSLVDGSSLAPTLSPVFSNITTTGSSDAFVMFFASGVTDWTGSCLGVGYPCPTGSFSEIAWNTSSGNFTQSQAEWINVPPQTNLSSGWAPSGTPASDWYLYAAAFATNPTAQESGTGKGSGRTGAGTLSTIPGSGSARFK